MRAVVDRRICIGCGLCESICPDIFAIDDEGQAVVVREEIPEPWTDCAREAERRCPAAAITVEK